MNSLYILFLQSYLVCGSARNIEYLTIYERRILVCKKSNCICYIRRLTRSTNGNSTCRAFYKVLKSYPKSFRSRFCHIRFNKTWCNCIRCNTKFTNLFSERFSKAL